MAFTVKASQTGSTDIGTAMYLLVLTGASAVQPGAAGGSATRSSASLSQTLTPLGSNSFVYASILALTTSGALSALSGQTMKYQPTGGGLSFNTVAASGTTAGSNITIGATDTSNTAIAIAAVEILQAQGKTLAQDASSPGGASAASSISVTSASFTPPGGSLLMASIATNGNTGSVGISMSDTSGFGLTWTQESVQNAAGNGYVGVWTAFIPGGPALPSPGISLMGVG